MKAGVFKGANTIVLEELERPAYGDTDILVQVMACGICGSDLRIMKHGHSRVSPPAILGHEVSGIIAAMGKDVAGFQIEDRVALSSDVPCGTCAYCNEGFCNNCDTHYAIGHQIPGGMAEYLVADKRIWNGGAFCKIPDQVSFEEAALAEPLACAVNGMEMVMPRRKETIVIIGSGVLGSLLAQLARVYGYKQVVLVDVDPQKLSFIRSRGIQADAFLPFTAELPKQIAERTEGRGADAVFAACGDPESQRMALALVGKRGWVNFFAGLPAGTPDISISSNDLHYREITLTGSHGSTPETHRTALSLIADGRVRVAELVTHTYSLDQLSEALAAASQPGNRLKIILKPNA